MECALSKAHVSPRSDLIAVLVVGLLAKGERDVTVLDHVLDLLSHYIMNSG